MIVVLAGLLVNEMLVCMDDIITYSSSIEEHCLELKKLLDYLDEVNLTRRQSNRKSNLFF